MKKLLIIIMTLWFFSTLYTYSQASSTYQLPEPVRIELNRLGEAYHILDQFADSVWMGWNDYTSFPFLMTFQNGLRILVGHPAPPSEFVSYPDVTVQGLSLHIDTTKLDNFQLRYPLLAGGGPLPFGTYNNKSVKVVNINFRAPISANAESTDNYRGEDNILIYIHELMHCYQPNILKKQYGNLRINPDMNLALYADIEGKALLMAYNETSLEAALPFLKDFCIARSLKIKDLKESEKNSYACDEFREGEAVYSEYVILQNLKKGFKSSLTAAEDTGYKHFENADALLSKYSKRLMDASGNTFEIYGKNYWYGCFEALLLQRYFTGWQKEVENNVFLDQIISKNVQMTKDDSLLVFKRFQEIYKIDSLTSKHGAIISGRDEAYKQFRERKGRTYIIDMKPISQYIAGLVNKDAKKHELGLIKMYPDGIGDIKADSIFASFKPVPTEIDQLYYVKMVDVDSDKHKKPYKIKYKSKDKNYYYNVTINTPLFTLNAPKVSIRESDNRVKFIIQSRN